MKYKLHPVVNLKLVAPVANRSSEVTYFLCEEHQTEYLPLSNPIVKSIFKSSMSKYAVRVRCDIHRCYKEAVYHIKTTNKEI